MRTRWCGDTKRLGRAALPLRSDHDVYPQWIARHRIPHPGAYARVGDTNTFRAGRAVRYRDAHVDVETAREAHQAHVVALTDLEIAHIDRRFVDVREAEIAGSATAE